MTEPYLTRRTTQTNSGEKTAYLFRYSRFFILVGLWFFLDQWSKDWVVRNVPFGTYINPPPRPFIDPILYIVHVRNTGAAWSILAGKSFWLACLAVISLISVLWFRHALNLREKMVQYAFGLLCGGILGNVWDRFQYGYVIDFLDLQLPWYRWPTFNIADIGISVGAILYIAWNIWGGSQQNYGRK